MIYKPPKRKVDTTFIHCSASDNLDHDHIDVIRQWHKERGWSDVGYHIFISKKHGVQWGRSLEKTPAAQKGYNTGSIAICLSGLDYFTDRQFQILNRLCIEIDNAHPNMRFRGHREVSNKTCPNFDYRGIIGLDINGHLLTSKPVLINTQKKTITQKIGKWFDNLNS